MAKISKNEYAWLELFDKYNILKRIQEDGIFKITASQINKYREARLMTKFDHSKDLPNVFSKNKLAILPDRRGSYVIGKFKAYQKLQVESINPTVKQLPDYLQSFDPSQVTSESIALNIAHASGMIDDVMATCIENHEPQSVLTLNGRMSSGNINYKIKLSKNDYYNFKVNNSQIEIDGSYENLNTISVVEAKNKLPEDFMIRQLYYPYRFFRNINSDKEIIPIFFTYADDIFSFHVYQFTDKMDYSSIKKIKQYNFILNDTLDLNLLEVKGISTNSPMMDEPTDSTYPQANNFLRILDMIDYLIKPKNKFELAKEYDFDVRQSDYYANALVYLGIAKKNQNSEFILNELGKKIQKMPNSNKRNKIIIERILSYKTFKLAFDAYLKSGGKFDTKFVSKILIENVQDINKESTAVRRSSTVKSWLDWILSVIDE
ncbi:type II restriction enzyme [Oceanobacillus oncorhynchi]|uniref:type II restriction enzyme n=1 Tax=Oceanobacillus oncorhynchi TaxID=545501 RepID=UPI001866CF28|nr:hypothetical protein [Oceanobacillus oncorhynchi]